MMSNEIILLFAASLVMSLFVLLDIAIPRDIVKHARLRLRRGAFYLHWPTAEAVTGGGDLSREFHMILFGYEVHLWRIDNIYTGGSSAARSIR